MARTLWRISRYPGVTGEGGLYVDGRWHTKGHRIIYAAEHPALALIETMAHLNLSIDEIPDDLKLCRLEVADVADLAFRKTLPDGWQSNELMSRKVGDAWLASLSHPLFEVPSAILPHSMNVLINPDHPVVQGLTTVQQVSVEDIWIDKRFIR